MSRVFAAVAAVAAVLLLAASTADAYPRTRTVKVRERRSECACALSGLEKFEDHLQSEALSHYISYNYLSLGKTLRVTGSSAPH